jgi:hypothetical protein
VVAADIMAASGMAQDGASGAVNGMHTVWGRVGGHRQSALSRFCG